MTAIIAQFQTTCPECRNLIHKGDPVVFGPDDTWIHEECDLDPNAWDDVSHPPPTVQKLATLLAARGTLIRAVFDAGIETNDLPEAIQDGFFKAMAHESTLVSLIEDVMAEHTNERTT